MVSAASASVANHSILDSLLHIAQMYSSNAFGQCAYLSCLHTPTIHGDIDTWVIGRGDGRAMVPLYSMHSVVTMVLFHLDGDDGTLTNILIN